jgi:hypothetical protein
MHVVLFLSEIIAGPVFVPDQPRTDKEERSLIHKAIEALGGEGPVAKLQNVRIKAKGSLEINNASGTFILEFLVRTPGRAKMDMQVTSGNATINLLRIRNQDRGWEQINGRTLESKPRQLSEIQAWGNLFDVRTLLPLLKAPGHSLSPLGEIMVNGRPGVGVKVSSKGSADIDLYFDKTSMLLVKSSRASYTLDDREVTLDIFYSDYRDAGGVKQPFKHLLLHDGKKFIEMEITEVRLPDMINDEEFAKP